MSGRSKTPLQPSAVARRDETGGKENQSGDEIGRRVAARPFLLVARGLAHSAEEIGHADHCDERRAQENADAEINERRDDGSQRLR